MIANKTNPKKVERMLKDYAAQGQFKEIDLPTINNYKISNATKEEKNFLLEQKKNLES